VLRKKIRPSPPLPTQADLLLPSLPLFHSSISLRRSFCTCTTTTIAGRMRSCPQKCCTRLVASRYSPYNWPVVRLRQQGVRRREDGSHDNLLSRSAVTQAEAHGDQWRRTWASWPSVEVWQWSSESGGTPAMQFRPVRQIVLFQLYISDVAIEISRCCIHEPVFQFAIF
jgi:hypothetical protein